MSDERIKILIVEDNLYAREVIKEGLSDLNCSFTEAADGEQAIELLRRSSFDVVILDVGLPGRSGLDTIRQAREENESLPPVIVLTGYLDASLEKEASERGVFQYLTKAPLQIDQLRTAVIKATES